MELSTIERDVLSWFAKHSGSEALRLQCQSATVASRQHTGPGLVTVLQVNETAPLADFGCAPNAPLISSPLFPYGGSVDLWLENGRIAELEFVVLGEGSWPKSDFQYQLVDAL